MNLSYSIIILEHDNLSCKYVAQKYDEARCKDRTLNSLKRCPFLKSQSDWLAKDVKRKKHVKNLL